MIKILLVEDDLSLSNSVFDFLDDFADVMQVFDGDEGLYEAKSGVYEMSLLLKFMFRKFVRNLRGLILLPTYKP